MSYNFVELKEINDIWAKKMCKWENDKKIRHLFNVIRDQEHYDRHVDWQKLKVNLNKSEGKRFGITLNEEPVGEFNFVYNHRAIMKKNIHTAWVGIIIGEEKARGNNLGFKAMRFLEEQIIKTGGNRVELGVFSFNHTAISLYEKLQYTKFDSIPDFTWWDGSMHDNLCYEKYLQPEKIR